jgi:uncharacterized protein (DUF2147 family)
MIGIGSRVWFAAIAWLLFAASSFAAHTDDVVGVWLNQEGDGLIRIERDGTSYRGTIIGAPEGTRKDPNARDVNNPDPELRDRRLVGMVLMAGYTFDGKSSWLGGWIYDPDVGKQYKARMTLTGPDTLEIRGYIGVPVLGRTEVWTRWTQFTE